MNPRILKKLCKRADPYVRKLTRLERFKAEGDSSIDTHQRVENKHLERWQGKPNKHGYFIALKNTIGYGERAGYYEPEWAENDAYSILKELVVDHFTDWKSFRGLEGESFPKCTKQITTPSDVFNNAEVLMLSN